MKTEKHFDGWKHSTLSYFRMLDYYKHCSKSVDILHQFLPYAYAVIPTTLIRFHKDTPNEIEIVRIYPGDHVREFRSVDRRVVCALRNCWVGKHPGWVGSVDGSIITFRRDGRLVGLTYKHNNRQFPSVR